MNSLVTQPGVSYRENCGLAGRWVHISTVAVLASTGDGGVTGVTRVARHSSLRAMHRITFTNTDGPGSLPVFFPAHRIDRLRWKASWSKTTSGEIHIRCPLSCAEILRARRLSHQHVHLSTDCIGPASSTCQAKRLHVLQPPLHFQFPAFATVIMNFWLPSHASTQHRPKRLRYAPSKMLY